jgi:transposase
LRISARNSERLEELDRKLEEQVRRLPNVDKLLSIRGVGMQTVVGFIAEVGDVNRFSDPKQLVKLAGLNAINNESCKRSVNIASASEGVLP